MVMFVLSGFAGLTLLFGNDLVITRTNFSLLSTILSSIMETFNTTRVTPGGIITLYGPES